MTALLEFKNVYASYAGAVVLQDVSFSIEEGEFVGLVGRNGAGKSTALHSVYGIPQVTGEILIDGKPISRKRYEPAARGISLVPQGKSIFPNLTVEENLLLGRAANRTGDWTVQAVYEIFPNLSRGSKRLGTQLSGGEQQMLAIGRALMATPQLLLLDEPTEGLAPVIVDELVGALQQIHERGTAVLLVEQHIGMIQKLATRFIALRTGELAASGPTEELQSREVQEIIAL
ncbi:ABC transporter ATP-binding protein [Citricoccus zhacaiensis]